MTLLQKQLRARKLSRERAVEQFLRHMQEDPECLLAQETDTVPSGLILSEREHFLPTRFAAMAQLKRGRYYMLAAGDGEYESTWIWARYQRVM